MQTEDTNEQLWKVAKARAAFKTSLVTYVLVNIFLHIVWYVTTGTEGYYWAIWPVLGWGIGLVFQYINAYHSNKMFSVENEYERLKNKQP